MDFAAVFRAIAEFIAAQGAPCAVIGGLALRPLGAARHTMDLDLVTTADLQPRLIPFLESLGYSTLHRSAG